MPGVGCWKQCAACTTGHAIQNHEGDSCDCARAQVVVVQDAVGVTRTCSAQDEAFKSSVPTPAERWETSDDTASGPSCQDSVTPGPRCWHPSCSLQRAVHRQTVSQLPGRSKVQNGMPRRGCLRETLRCLPQRLFQYLSPFGLRRKRAHVATVSSTTSYQKFALEAIAHVSLAQGSLMPP